MEDSDSSKALKDSEKICRRIYKKWGFIWDFETQYTQILVLFLMFGLFFGLGYLVKGVGFDVTFWISEFDKEVTSHFTAKDILDLVNINLIFPIFAVWTRKSVNLNYSKYFHNNHSAKDINSDAIVTNSINWGDILFYFFMALMIFGNTSHVIANRFTHLLQNEDLALRDTPLFYSIYFWDEYFGHLAIVSGLYGMALTNLHKQIRIPLIEYKISADKWVQMILTGIGMGTGLSLTMMEGQSNPPLFLLNLILLIYLIFYVLRSKNLKEINGNTWSIKNHPIIVVFILEAIFFIIASIIWGLVYGIMDHYPIFYQKGGERLW